MHQDTMSLRRGRGVCESDGELSITHKIYSRCGSMISAHCTMMGECKISVYLWRQGSM
uniref:Uncharacterized protein n=1 Tax=Physcomitrium patens TaxID=3218 RepID=A0A2K1K756_PHYPA|nr:hypothetical protein PHYPA_011503 [Physcomitrium patens]